MSALRNAKSAVAQKSKSVKYRDTKSAVCCDKKSTINRNVNPVICGDSESAVCRDTKFVVARLCRQSKSAVCCDVKSATCCDSKSTICRDSKSAVSRSCNSAAYSWDRRSFEQHRMRVRKATPTVNMKTPESRPHVCYDAKRSQIERERQAQIARDNFILFKRLTEIMSGKMQRKYPLTQGKSKCIKPFR